MKQFITMKNCIFLFFILFIFILNCSGGHKYFVDGKSFDNQFAAESEFLISSNNRINKILPLKEPVGGRALVSIPERSIIKKYIVSISGKNVTEENIEYASNISMIAIESIYKSVKKRNIFDHVDLAHSINTKYTYFSEFDFLIYFITESPTSTHWHIRPKNSEQSYPVIIDKNENDPLRSTYTMLDSIESIARANYTPQKSPPAPTIATQTPAIITSDKRLALVIGNSAYRSAPLRNPVNDARDMAGALRDMGFEVIQVVDADRRGMIQAVLEFGNKLPRADVGLFYYAGHGVQVDGRNYLIPVDAQVHSESEIEFESVDVGRLLAQMESARSKVNIVILDACRDNPFERSFRTTSRGLAKMDSPQGSYIAFATSPGSVAADGDGRNGVFTEHLLANMRVPGLKIEDVMKRTRIGVAGATNNRQMPWDSSSLLGDFYFVPK